MQRLLAANSSFEPVYSRLYHCKNYDFSNQKQKNVLGTITIPVNFHSSSDPGLHEYTRQQEEDLKQQVRNRTAKQSMLQNYKNFKSSSAPSRLMYYQDGSWIDFSDEVVAATKVAFLERNPMKEIIEDGNLYIFDFYRMLQIDVENGLQRSIAWIDALGKCCFPQFFVDFDGEHDCSEVPKIEIEIEIRLDNNNDNNNNNNNNNDSVDVDQDNFSRNGKRKRRELVELESEENDTANSSSSDSEANNKLKKQRLIGGLVPAPKVASNWPNTKLMTGWEKAYPVLRDSFLARMKNIDPGCEITAIRQFTCSGPAEKVRWDVFYKQLESTKACRGNARPVSAWYGTSKEQAMEVLAHGFISPSKVYGFQSYGNGVYLSGMRYPHMSHMLTELDNNNERHLLLCRVISGNVEKVEAGSLQTHPSSMNYDTGVDNTDDPKWYVVWSANMNTHILPMCVVSYKCSKEPKDTPGIIDVKKYLPVGSSVLAVKFLSALGHKLSPRKADILKALCKLYKDGKMIREAFVQQMRLLAGEEAILSAIRDCQGSK